MPQNEDIIWNTITNSAKTRFDYTSFEAAVSEYDERIAENMLFITLLGHAQDKGVESIASDLSTKLLLLGLGGANDEIKEFVELRLSDLPLEIKAMQQALALKKMGAQTPGILVEVKSILQPRSRSGSNTTSAPTTQQLESGLSETCKASIGKPLTFSFEYGMGWTQVINGEYSQCEAPEGFMGQVTPSDFFSHKNIPTKGFMGKIEQGEHPFSGYHIVSIPNAVGSDFNFTDTPCSLWKIWLSEQQFTAPTKSFRQLRSANMVVGYAHIYDGAYSEAL